MKPNFEAMSKAELKAYVLSHRDDDEAIRVFFGRRNPPDSEATWYGPMCTPEGLPIEENIRIAEEAIRQKVDRDREKQKVKELEAMSFSPIDEGWVNTKESKMTVVTKTKIEQYREQLLKDYPEALVALDVIEEYEGNLAEAAKAIAIRNDIEGVADYGLLDWFSGMLEECRDFICQPKYENLRENYLPALIPPLADCSARSLGCPPGVAAIIAVPFAAYIKEEGMEKFCKSSNSQP